ncbi:MAG: hypothetical protein WBY94_29715 [Polyangiaceae bacterium]
MGKALSLSILIAMFWIPIFYAGEPRQKRGLRKVVTRFAVYCAIYVVLILYVAPRLG